MAKLTGAKEVTRETSTLYRYKPLIATLDARTLRLRVKGDRKAMKVTVPLDAIYDLGMKLAAREAFADKVRAGTAGR